MKHTEVVKWPFQPNTIKGLAIEYRVTRKTLSSWLTKHKKEIGPRAGYYFTPKQVKIIHDTFGPPGMI